MDELVTSRPASEPMVGPAGQLGQDLPADFDAARRRLGRSAREGADRLGERLRSAIDQYDLGRRELMAAQHQIKRLRRAGLVPSPTEYWETTAVPRAEVLVEAAVDAIVDEGERLTEAVERFLTATSRSTLEPWINGAEGRAAIQQTGTAAIERLLTAVPPPDPIDALGEWWQRKLHRRALGRALPRLMTSRASTESIISAAELAVLDSSPWCFGDRLLSAFELAHAEIRSQANGMADDLSGRIGKRGAANLVEVPGRWTGGDQARPLTGHHSASSGLETDERRAVV